MPTLNVASGIRKTFNIQSIFISFAWLSGLLTGLLVLCETAFSSLMYSVIFSRMSIVSSLILLVIPMLLSYILLRHFHLYCVLPLVFLKAVSFICCYGSFLIVFKNAG